MSRTVFCKKYQQELEGLAQPPFPGPKGQMVFDSVSLKAWQEWQTIQTMLINEKQLNMMQADARKYIMEQMEKFFNNEATDKAEGYVDPKDIKEL